MIKRNIVETVYEYDKDGKLTRSQSQKRMRQMTKRDILLQILCSQLYTTIAPQLLRVSVKISVSLVMMISNHKVHINVQN